MLTSGVSPYADRKRHDIRATAIGETLRRCRKQLTSQAKGSSAVAGVVGMPTDIEY